ncbi:gustatory receptor, partial [Homalodisca vitripennis]
MLYTPLRWVYRIFGIAPSDSPSDKYFTAIGMILFLGTTLKTTSNLPIIDDLSEYYVRQTAIVSFYIAPTAFLVCNFCWRISYNNILHDLEVIGEELSTQEKLRNQKILFFIFFWMTTFLAIITNLLTGKFLIFGCLWIINYTIFILPMTQMMVLVDIIHYRFSVLNAQLSDISMEYNNMPLHDVMSKLDSVFRLHTQLHIVVFDINAHYCLYNLFTIIAKVGTAVYKMHQYLRTLSGHRTWFWYVPSWIPCIWELITLLVQICVCHACAQEANRSALLAHHILRPDTPIQLWEQISLFSRLTLHHKVRFSVGGIFTLDRSLISKLSVTALSYLIIAVQLKEVEPYIGEYPDRQHTPSRRPPELSGNHISPVPRRAVYLITYQSYIL